MKFVKFAPQVLSAVLAVALVVLYIVKNTEIENVRQQNEALSSRYNALIAEADKRQKLIEEAAQKHQKTVEEATQKQQQLVAEANQLISAARLPEATVNITFRPAMMGSGFVARITNTSTASIPVTIEVKRSSTGQTKEYESVINGNAFKEIGHQEGWPFVSGDEVTVKQPNHKAKTKNLP